MDDTIREVLAEYGRLAVDETELKGAWDFDLKFTPRGMVTPTGPIPGSLSLFDAVDRQLGLRLDPVEVPMPVIVVDSVNRKPTDNVPGIEKLVPVVPTEFEVADLKPSAPNAQIRGGLQPGGRIDLQGLTLKQLMLVSLGLPAGMRRIIGGALL